MMIKYYGDYELAISDFQVHSNLDAFLDKYNLRDAYNRWIKDPCLYNSVERLISDIYKDGLISVEDAVNFLVSYWYNEKCLNLGRLKQFITYEWFDYDVYFKFIEKFGIYDAGFYHLVDVYIDGHIFRDDYVFCDEKLFDAIVKFLEKYYDKINFEKVIYDLYVYQPKYGEELAYYLYVRYGINVKDILIKNGFKISELYSQYLEKIYNGYDKQTYIYKNLKRMGVI